MPAIMQYTGRSCPSILAALLLAAGAGCVAPVRNDGMHLGIHEAALYGYINQVRVCLLDGADVNARDAAGATPLHMAATGGWPEVARLLLEKGALVNARDRLTGATPLIMAAMHGYTDMVVLLLENGADIHMTTFRGATALHAAAAGGSVDIVRRLLEYGADPYVIDAGGRQPGNWAQTFGHASIARILPAAELPAELPDTGHDHAPAPPPD